MNDNDVSKLRDLIKEEVTSIVKEELKPIKETLKDHTRRLEALSGDAEHLHSDVKGIRDEIDLWHQRDKREIDEIKKHLDLPLLSDTP